MAKQSLLKFKTKIHRLQHLVGMHYLEIPKKIVQQLGGKFNVRLICTVNEVISYQCGIVALGKGKGYISINAKRMLKGGLKEGDTITVLLKKDESNYGMEMSEELKELLAQDEEGVQRFRALTPGMQRYIIYYVSGVKSPHLRLERALKLITNLKKTKPGKETFREILGVEKR